MNIYKYLAAVAILDLFSQVIFAQDYNLLNVSEAKLRRHVFFMASDSMYGWGIESSVFYTSDNYHLPKFNIPVLHLSTSYTDNYHKPSDKSEKIRTNKTERTTRLCFLEGLELGNQE